MISRQNRNRAHELRAAVGDDEHAFGLTDVRLLARRRHHQALPHQGKAGSAASGKFIRLLPLNTGMGFAVDEHRPVKFRGDGKLIQLIENRPIGHAAPEQIFPFPATGIAPSPFTADLVGSDGNGDLCDRRFQSFVRPTVEPVYFADQEHVARQRRAHTPVFEHTVATVAPLAHTWLWLTGPGAGRGRV